MNVSEAPLEETEHGRMPAGEGWFVLNAKDARWRRDGTGGKGDLLRGRSGDVAARRQRERPRARRPDGDVPLRERPGGLPRPRGEPVLVVEGQERQLRPWDLVHCPPGTNHVIVGAGEGASVVVAVGVRSGREDWGAYTVDETARRHGASVEDETTDARTAYAGFPADSFSRYEEGWLPY